MFYFLKGKLLKNSPQGQFSKQGISRFKGLVNGYQISRIEAEDLVEAAITKCRSVNAVFALHFDSFQRNLFLFGKISSATKNLRSIGIVEKRDYHGKPRKRLC